MRRIRVSKVTAILLSACMMVMLLSTTALAKSGYVPTEATVTSKTGDDTDTYSIKMAYTKDGRITNYTFQGDYSYRTDYTWSKNRVIRRTSTESDGDTSFTAYTYKKKRLAAIESKYAHFHSIGTYTWKKGKSASVVTNVTEEGTAPYQTTGTIKLNGKKKIVSESTTLNGRTNTVNYKYYGNGNYKSIISKGNITEATPNMIVITNSVQTFNKNGYITSYHYDLSDGTSTDFTYSYVMDKKMKCPTQVTVNRSYGGITTVETWTFTNFQKVKRVRNCDDGGISVPLAAN